MIIIRGKNNENFKGVLTLEESLQLNGLVNKLYKADIELVVEYRELKTPITL